jgi:pimeloyl-ACP methyl ester carboxylesterase
LDKSPAMFRKTGLTVFLILCLLFCVNLHSFAQQTPQKFVQETHYLLYLPQGYDGDTSARWPLVIFLHGAGESGTDLNKVKVHGPPKLVEQGKSFPFILVSPQATRGWPPHQLYPMLQDIKKKLRVDPDRVYLTGLSMGGYGTWALAMEHPEEFAAIAPICGGGDTAKIYRLRYMPIWNFHGAKDPVVPLSASEKMVNALKQYNPNAKFTIYPEADHDSWTETYNNDEFYKWLLSQKRFKFTESPLRNKELQAYVGEYVTPNNDTVAMVAQGDSLVLNTRRGGNNFLHLKHYRDGIFYLDPSQPNQARFIRNKKGEVDGFMYEAEERFFVRRLKK